MLSGLGGVPLFATARTTHSSVNAKTTIAKTLLAKTSGFRSLIRLQRGQTHEDFGKFSVH